MPQFPAPLYWNEGEPCAGFAEGFPFTLPPLARAVRLSQGSPYFRALKAFVERSSQASRYASSKGEDARMKYMRMVSTADWASEFQQAIARRRLQEPVKGAGIKPPRSCHITVRDIFCVQHGDLWDRYCEAREGLLQRYTGTQQGTNNLYFATRTEPRLDGMLRLPVLNEVIGESMLYHVTSPDCIQKITQTGFKASYGRNYGTNERPRYGMLGQGNYFSNEISKGLTYSTCFLCGDYQCGCRSVETRKKLTRSTLLVRVILGNPRYYATLAYKKFRRAAVEREFRAAPFTHTRFEPTDQGGGGFDSVISHGHNPGQGKFAFTTGTGSGMNEIMSPKDELIYPEFVVMFVMGDDDEAPNLTEVVRTVLRRYQGRTFSWKSDASKRAVQALSNAVQANRSDEYIGDLILYLVGVKDWAPGLENVNERNRPGRIKTDGTLFRYLVEEMQRHGYLAVA